MERMKGQTVTAYLGLGSNIGDRDSNLREAVVRLGDSAGLTVVAISSIYETAPWGYTDQPDFLNCVLEIETRLTPTELLARTEKVEQDVGRTPSWRYGPRLIDVDILLYGEQCLQLDDPDLVIPHPRMELRAFVLIPLAEIARDEVHPGLKRTISELASKFDEQEGVRIWAPRRQLDDLVGCQNRPPP